MNPLHETAIEIQVGEMLRQGGVKLVVAESCTGGLVSDRLTDVPGSADYYLGGITSYANEAKEILLGVDRLTLEDHGAVSRQTALEMARRARQAFAGVWAVEKLVGLSTTGIAGPGGGTPEKPVGLLWIGLSTPQGDYARQFVWDGSRRENKEKSAHAALGLLAAYLNGSLFTASLQPLEVTWRQDHSGRTIPGQFYWQGAAHKVDSVGRRWEDEAGEHILVMVGEEVHELVHAPQEAGWFIKPRSRSARI